MSSGPDPVKRWQQIDQLLDEALCLEPTKRQAFLEQACAGDKVLRREVEALLAAHDQASRFMEKPALDAASQTLEQKESQYLVGRKLGPYEILSLLGRGGMGEVFRARDTRLDRIAALKILPSEVATDPERLRRFVREAKAASALNHPNIATIYDIGESDGIHWITMELVEGETLAERLNRNGLGVAAIIDIGMQAAEALEEAHSKGITHRDIKPANLMLTTKGKVKVLDFGLAKITRQEGSAAATATSETHTFPGLVMGTARYMSPEQWIYFESDHGGDSQVWRMPAEGGEEVQVTRKGGSNPRESMDGKILFYLKPKDEDHAELWKVPVGGGEESRILGEVLSGNFDMKQRGIYYAAQPPGKETQFLFYDFATGKTKHVATIQHGVGSGFTVSPDEQWILYTQFRGNPQSDLMLVENFR